MKHTVEKKKKKKKKKLSEDQHEAQHVSMTHDVMMV